MDSYVDIESVN